ncbi:DUF192 domain-containing protein, partial [bacterium]|nr:DUF192 domain-containing protein [bacterium]
MTKTILILILSLILLLVLFFGIFQKKKQGQVCFKDYCFEVDIAQSFAQRAKGLMFREKLEKNQGMLFIFKDEKKHNFWMKNVSFPLDIIWIDANKKVVFISPNNQPCDNTKCFAIQPKQKAKYVLEINGGMAKEIGIKIGNQ